MNHPPRLALPAVVALAAAWAVPSTARADDLDLYLTPGITLSTTLGEPRSEWAIGLGCSFVRRLPDEAILSITQSFVGGVALAQVFFDGTLRVSVGAEGGYSTFGVELGLAMRTASARRPFTVALHGGAFASVGYANIGYDLNLTLGAPAGVAPREHLLQFGLGLPLVYDNRYTTGPDGTTAVLDGHQWEVFVPQCCGG